MSETIAILLSAALATLGFSLIFCVPVRHLPLATAGGFVATAFYLLFMEWTAGLFVSNLLATFLAVLFSQACARISHAPTTIFQIPSLVPLVPGGKLYYAMSALLAVDYEQFLARALETAQIGLGIAGGIIAASVVESLLRRALEHMAEAK